MFTSTGGCSRREMENAVDMAILTSGNNSGVAPECLPLDFALERVNALRHDLHRSSTAPDGIRYM